VRNKSKIAYLLLPVLLFAGLTYAAGTMVVDSLVHPDPRIGKRYIQIYLPEGYDPGGTIEYPVIYFLHGAKDGVGSGYANHLSYPYMQGILDAMIGNGIIEPVIMVKPNAVCSPYVISWYTNSVLNGHWENYTYSSIVSFIESNYNAIPDPDYRFGMGHSAGGYGAMRAGYRHLNLFSAVAAHSLVGEIEVLLQVGLPLLLTEYPEGPPYHWNPTRGFYSAVVFSFSAAWTPNLSNPPFYVDLPLDSLANYVEPVLEVWRTHALPVFVESMPPGTYVRTYFDCGSLDELACFPQCCTLSARLDRLGYEHEYQVFAGGHFDSLPTRFPVGIAFLVGIKATPEFEPAVLNLKSKGKYITCYIELPASYSAADIDPGTVVLDRINGEELDLPLPAIGPHAVGDWDKDGIPDLMVKFDRQALIDELVALGIGPGEDVELRVAGELESQIPFRDVGTIHVVGGGGGAQAERRSSALRLDLQSAGSAGKELRYGLPNAARVRLRVYDMSGRLAATLVNGMQVAGSHAAVLDGAVPDGVYIVRLEADDRTVTAKLVRAE